MPEDRKIPKESSLRRYLLEFFLTSFIENIRRVSSSAKAIYRQNNPLYIQYCSPFCHMLSIAILFLFFNEVYERIEG